MKTPDIEKFLEEFAVLLTEYYQEKPLNLSPKKAKERALAFVNSLKRTQSYDELRGSAQRGIAAVKRNKKKRAGATSFMKQSLSKRFKSKDVADLLQLSAISEPLMWLIL